MLNYNSPLVWASLVLPLISAHPTKNSFNWDTTKHVIAFGDSYTYVQGTHGRQNYSFIGDYQNLNFSASDLLSDKIVQNQTGTAEGGPNWLEYLTGCGLTPGLTSPLDCDIQLWDFAFAGADISLEYTPQHHNYTVPFVNATSQFLTYAQPILSPLLSPQNTLITIWIGINDISDTSSLNTDFSTLYADMITTLFASLTPIAALGYPSFLIMNLPPLDRTPANLLTPTPLPNTSMLQLWNTLLTVHAAAFAKTTGTEVKVFDTNAFLNGVLEHHEVYGLRNTTGFCAAYDQPGVDTDPGKYGCRPLDEYFWFNSGHLTSRVHGILAGEVGRWLRGW